MGVTQTIATVWIFFERYNNYIDIHIGDADTVATLTPDSKCVSEEFTDGVFDCVGSGRYLHIVQKGGDDYMTFKEIKIFDQNDQGKYATVSTGTGGFITGNLNRLTGITCSGDDSCVTI